MHPHRHPRGPAHTVDPALVGSRVLGLSLLVYGLFSGESWERILGESPRLYLRQWRLALLLQRPLALLGSVGGHYQEGSARHMQPVVCHAHDDAPRWTSWLNAPARPKP